MNPLDLPKWGKKKPEIKLEGPKIRASFLGMKAEVMLIDKDAEHHVVIEVRNAKGHHPGAYKVAYVEGQPLGVYLRKLRLKRAACYSAVYDLNAKNHGRLRMTYIPKKDSHIVIGAGSLGISSQYQRSSVDAQQVAARMGGGKKVVEAKK